MSIKLYTGRMGSGKSYEVVSVVILGALSRGRRVVSNIAGLDYDAMKALLMADGQTEETIGPLIQVSHDDVQEPHFWRTDKDAAEGINAFIQPGDLVALDEIWRFWEGFGSRKMPDRVMNFYRMHRHFVSTESGLTCDVALITQDPMDLARRVRAVVEETYRMEKLTAIGSTRRYRVDVYQGCSRPKFLRAIQRTYEDKFFPLYKSHSQAQAGGAGPKEENIDDRGNILKGALFKVILPLMIPLFGIAIYYLWGFFHPTPASKPTSTGTPQAQTQANKPGTAPAQLPAGVNTRWRAVGHISIGDGPKLYLAYDEHNRGRIIYLFNKRLESSRNWKMEIKSPDGQITEWSGSIERKEGK